MDQDLVSMSSRISNTAKDQPKIQMKTLLPPPPPPPEPKKKKEKKELPDQPTKKEKEEEKEKKEDEMVELRRKVRTYLSKPQFKNLLSEIDLPGPKSSDADWRGCYESINETLKGSYKELMIRTMFQTGCKASETVMVQFLSMNQFTGLSDDILAHMDDFEPELTELAIEMSNGWVPGPVPRLLMKFMNKIQKYGQSGGGGSSQSKKEERE